ncbi:ferritin-like domain-containing protein [Sphingomonas aracearum]|uniref:Ferritin-like domain-containing protein n=1 Tax=Sphingomonas aracearum TaxID=2283317 RepID=A0A369VV79_9SPHN|nr:ferritin-like domain-containing protein [Sphingomonas aracearum]RDE05993.1 ferritin-like domain-containing protein [Sphingomonas aracearum]
MRDTQTILDMMEAAGQQRAARRRFIRMCGGAAAIAGSLSVLSGCDDDDDDDVTPTPTATATPTPTPTATSSSAVSDVDVLNFALNLEYLEGAYYYQAAFGSTIPAASLTGTGQQGTVIGGAQVNFTDTVVREFAREIAVDELAHINFLRQTLGTVAVAQPAINIAGDATGAFTAAARAAGVIRSDEVFNPYANDENFLIGAYLLTDVGVSAYRGSARLITNKVFLEASAGILATECYHDAAIRSTLYAKGLAPSDLRAKTVKISDTRDLLDGPNENDQGIIDADGNANIVPTDAGGLVLGRTAQQVLNVVYNNRASVVGGGFFPQGVNGTIRQSAAN